MTLFLDECRIASVHASHEHEQKRSDMFKKVRRSIVFFASDPSFGLSGAHCDDRITSFCQRADTQTLRWRTIRPALTHEQATSSTEVWGSDAQKPNLMMASLAARTKKPSHLQQPAQSWTLLALLRIRRCTTPTVQIASHTVW